MKTKFHDFSLTKGNFPWHILLGFSSNRRTRKTNITILIFSQLNISKFCLVVPNKQSTWIARKHEWFNINMSGLISRKFIQNGDQLFFQIPWLFWEIFRFPWLFKVSGHPDLYTKRGWELKKLFIQLTKRVWVPFCLYLMTSDLELSVAQGMCTSSKLAFILHMQSQTHLLYHFLCIFQTTNTII